MKNEVNELFRQLIGYQLMTINEEGFVVKKGNDIKHFEFEMDEGGCCGYNEFTASLAYENEDDIRNPIITNIETVIGEGVGWGGDSLLITFYGEHKTIAKIESFSYSGSGWGYGACVKVRCKETNQEQILTEW